MGDEMSTCRVRKGPPIAETEAGCRDMPASEQNAQVDSAGDFVLFADAIREVSPDKRPLFLAYLSRAWNETADLAAHVEHLTGELDRLRRPPPTRADRLAERDGAIRALLSAEPYASLSPSAASKMLAGALGAYLSGGWPRERDLDHLTGASEHRQTLHRIAKLNGGHSLGPRQIINIRDGFRTY